MKTSSTLLFFDQTDIKPSTERRFFFVPQHKIKVNQNKRVPLNKK